MMEFVSWDDYSQFNNYKSFIVFLGHVFHLGRVTIVAQTAQKGQANWSIGVRGSWCTMDVLFRAGRAGHWTSQPRGHVQGGAPQVIS